MELTSSDLDRFKTPLTAADLIRILRNAELAKNWSATGLLQAVLEDGSQTAAARMEIEQELPHMTGEELHVMAMALLQFRHAQRPTDDKEKDAG